MTFITIRTFLPHRIAGIVIFAAVGQRIIRTEIIAPEPGELAGAVVIGMSSVAEILVVIQRCAIHQFRHGQEGLPMLSQIISDFLHQLTLRIVGHVRKEGEDDLQLFLLCKRKNALQLFPIRLIHMRLLQFLRGDIQSRLIALIKRKLIAQILLFLKIAFPDQVSPLVGQQIVVL